jgi:hypothetical protein
MELFDMNDAMLEVLDHVVLNMQIGGNFIQNIEKERRSEENALKNMF